MLWMWPLALNTKWTLPPTISAADQNGFTVRLTSATDATMWVECVYLRGGSPAWNEH